MQYLLFVLGAVGNMLQSNDSSFQPNPPGQSSTRSPVADSGLETVPLKYRRKPISIEEMEYIEVRSELTWYKHM